MKKRESGVQRRMRRSGVGCLNGGCGLWEFILDAHLYLEVYRALASSHIPCIDSAPYTLFFFFYIIVQV